MVKRRSSTKDQSRVEAEDLQQIGDLHAAGGEFRKAAKHYERARNGSGNNASLLTRLADAYSAAWDERKAYRTYRQALQQDPDHP